MSKLFAEFGVWIIGLVGLIVTGLTLWFGGKKSGAEKEKTKAAEAMATKEIEAARDAAKVQIETAKGASNVQNDINKLSDGDAAKQLQDEWRRD